jgi:hypothetical protein
MMRVFTEAFTSWTGKQSGLAPGELDLPGFAFAGLVATGIYRLSIGNIVAPAWHVTFW